jgi:hypothetical protein
MRNLLYQNIRYVAQKYGDVQKQKVSLNSIIPLKAVYASIALSAVKLG